MELSVRLAKKFIIGKNAHTKKGEMTLFSLRRVWFYFLLAGFFLTTYSNLLAQEIVSSTVSLSYAIKKIEKETGFRFLYRESFTNSIQLPYSRNASELLNKIQLSLEPLGVSLLIDSVYKHILVFERKSTTLKKRVILLQVNDNSSGEYIPYATTVVDNKFFKTDEFGRLSLQFSESDSVGLIHVYASGYETQTIVLPEKRGLYQLNPRLSILEFEGEELIISGKSENDQFSEARLQSGNFSVGGEWSLIRSTQNLPAVFAQTAFDRHIILRGGTPDGVLIQLDGVTQFESTHFFGLTDSYSNDILQFSGLHYDIIPGKMNVSNGGIYDLRTRSGNRNRLQTTAALTNTSFRLSLDGPLPGSAGTWTLGGKTGIVNQITGLGNSERIAWGLDTGREIRVQDSRYTPAETNLYQSNTPSVNFYDLHGKINLETKDGSTIQLTGYLGGDNLKQSGYRYDQLSDALQFSERFGLSPVETENNWLQTSLGFSYWSFWKSWLLKFDGQYAYYESFFGKDDYTYLYSQPQEDALVRSYVEQFQQSNQFSESKTGFSMSQSGNNGYSLEMGLQLSRYVMSYEEESFSYPYFSAYYNSLLVEPYLQQSLQWKKLKVTVGLRAHYYSDGNYVRFSPRIQSSLNLTESLAFSAGFVHGYQFLNRLSLYNTVTSDVWIPASSEQVPLQMNHVFTDLDWKPFLGLSAKVSAYYKLVDNVRMHEINTRNYTSSFNPEPWFYDHQLESYGLEAQVTTQLGQFFSTISYTWSTTNLKNAEINNGDWFPAYWDRRHQIKSTASYRFNNGLSLSLTGVLASGIPAREPGSTGLVPNRLDLYKRLDAGLNYNGKTTKLDYSISLSIYNLLDIQNPWYRDEIQAFDSIGDNANLITVQADILDLGILPSLEFKINF